MGDWRPPASLALTDGMIVHMPGCKLLQYNIFVMIF